jgi:hypothetical protein
VATAAFMAGDSVVVLQSQQADGHSSGLFTLLGVPVLALVPLSFASFGAFIETQRSGNRVGRLMMLVGFGFAVATFTTDYPGVVSSGQAPTRPFGLAVVWISTWIWSIFLAALMSLLLLFPTGTLPSRRWRPVLWGGLTVFAVAGVLGAIQSGPTGNIPIDNPLGFVPVPEIVSNVLVLLALIGLIAALASLVVRYRTSTGVVRQQLKWFTYGAAITLPLFMAAALTEFGSVVGLLAFASLAALPFCMGIAVLRYRLYDIDVLINRTLVWGALTLTLGALYLGGVILLQALFRSITGQVSDLAVAIVTLAVAGLFNPWRRRLQTFIDRRFYRRKYDAARILAGLQGTLRDEVELDRLSQELVSVVQETVEARHVSLWLP